MLRAACHVAIVACILVAMLPAAPAQAGCGPALPATCEGTVPGGFGSEPVAFTAEIPARSRLFVEVSNLHDDPWYATVIASLVDPDGSTAAEVAVLSGETGNATAVAEGASTWTILVDGWGAEADLAYRLAAWLEDPPAPVPPQDDCGSRQDAGNAYDGRHLLLAAPTACDGSLARYDDPHGYGSDFEDVFIVGVRAGEVLVVHAALDTRVRHASVCIDAGGFACAELKEGLGAVAAQAHRTRGAWLFVDGYPAGLGPHPYALAWR